MSASVCACLIVRNESATFPRLAASVAGVIDRWIVVDTGSTDGTQDVVRATLGHLPGELYERSWVDFGHNRSELMELAQDQADWLLLVDADMTLTGSLNRDELDPAIDCYLVEHPGDTSYWIPRLVRGDRAWRFEGVTHEYLTAVDGAGDRRAKLPGLKIVHHADGGSRAGKFERDRSLLERAVVQDPQDTRSWFYLGRTYADLGEPKLALEAFSTRVHLGGWNEEAYYAQFECGNALHAIGDVHAAIAAWLSAWELRPSRLEALHAAVRELRTRRLYQAAFALADPAISQPMPDDILFVQPGVWTYELPLEHSICAYWVLGPRACLAESERLLAQPELPSRIRDFAENNAALCRRDLGLVPVPASG